MPRTRNRLLTQESLVVLIGVVRLLGGFLQGRLVHLYVGPCVRLLSGARRPIITVWGRPPISRPARSGLETTWRSCAA